MNYAVWVISHQFSKRISFSEYYCNNLFTVHRTSRTKPTQNDIEEKKNHRKEENFALIAMEGFAKSSRSQLNDGTSAPILRLNIDCCEEVFDYLPLADLYALGQTCRSMRKVVGEYFKETYASVDIQLADKNSIQVWPQAVFRDDFVKMENFNEFAPKLTINVNQNDYHDMNIDEFTSLNQLYFTNGKITDANMTNFRKKLANIEMLNLECSEIDEPYGSVLKYCKRLKHLSIHTHEKLINPRTNWLRRHYPMLEHLELKCNPLYRNDGFYGFLERHSTIKTFITNANFLWSHRSHFQNSIAKIDLFEFEYSDHADADFWSVLKQMHANGFYKRLHFRVYTIDDEMAKQIASIPAIEMLSVGTFGKQIPLPHFDNLKKLHISICHSPYNAEILAKVFTNLEEVFIGHAPYDFVMAFIKNSPKLAKFKIEVIPNLDETSDEEHPFNGGNLDLVKLNNERRQLNGARKIVIYVPDNIFIPTKRATKNGETCMNYIAIRRTYKFRWDDHPY